MSANLKAFNIGLACVIAAAVISVTVMIIADRNFSRRASVCRGIVYSHDLDSLQRITMLCIDRISTHLALSAKSVIGTRCLNALMFFATLYGLVAFFLNAMDWFWAKFTKKE
ncbi:hypothetical protein ACFL6I_23300 [candidate division KSB1 bacterium]